MNKVSTYATNSRVRKTLIWLNLVIGYTNRRHKICILFYLYGTETLGNLTYDHMNIECTGYDEGRIADQWNCIIPW